MTARTYAGLLDPRHHLGLHPRRDSLGLMHCWGGAHGGVLNSLVLKVANDPQEPNQVQQHQACAPQLPVNCTVAQELYATSALRG